MVHTFSFQEVAGEDVLGGVSKSSSARMRKEEGPNLNTRISVLQL